MSALPGLLIGLILTLFVYSYIVRDNALYRFAVHILVGITAAYAAVVAVEQILLPLIGQGLFGDGDTLGVVWLIPAALTLLLMLKLLRPVAWLGNSAVAALLGVGSAVALVGAISGTVLPLTLVAPSASAVVSLLAVVLTACALLYFQFTGRTDAQGVLVEPGWRRAVRVAGRSVLMITFGALFAGLLSTSIALFVERVSFYLTGIISLMDGFS